MNLFNISDEPVVLHSGMLSHFKVDCDDLSDADLEAIAALYASSMPPFTLALGVPRGGLRLAAALNHYADSFDAVRQHLIVDDVLTTGGSMYAMRKQLLRSEDDPNNIYRGVVLFARGPVPDWITPIFSLHKDLYGI